jgi:competence CoiA-like predicted nuclease
MFFADDGSGARVEAWPKARAVCPLCRRLVRARCGEVVEWYWAHEQGASCDAWAESETPWHRWWKLRADPDQREVVIGEHRADILTPKGVIELQHSHRLGGNSRAQGVLRPDDLAPRWPQHGVRTQ